MVSLRHISNQCVTAACSHDNSKLPRFHILGSMVWYYNVTLATDVSFLHKLNLTLEKTFVSKK